METRNIIKRVNESKIISYMEDDDPNRQIIVKWYLKNAWTFQRRLTTMYPLGRDEGGDDNMKGNMEDGVKNMVFQNTTIIYNKNLKIDNQKKKKSFNLKRN